MTIKSLERTASENHISPESNNSDVMIRKCHGCGKELKIPKYIDKIRTVMLLKSSDEKNECPVFGKQYDGFFISYDAIPYCTKECFDFSTED